MIVDYNAGAHLAAAVDSVLAQGVDDVVVVDNAGDGASLRALGALARATSSSSTPGRNLGFGAGANRGVAALGDAELVARREPRRRRCTDGAVDALVDALEAHPSLGASSGRRSSPRPRRRTRRCVGSPRCSTPSGTRRSGASGRATRSRARYREQGAAPDGTADWVSGSCFLVRRELFERLGGFDERYFMFAEDMDLCWRAHRAGAEVGTAPDAVVTHAEGVSRRVAPYRMQVAHHRSALRFAVTTTTRPRTAAAAARGGDPRASASPRCSS